MARSLNKVMLLGNLTRDPELRYTPQGTAVCTFGMATNRQWKTESGDTRDEAEFHRIVAWTKLAEICANLIKKGRKIYAEGRLSTRSWQAQDGTKRYKTEVIANNIQLGPRSYSSSGGQHSEQGNFNQNANNQPSSSVPPQNELETIEYPEEDINPEDIPF